MVFSRLQTSGSLCLIVENPCILACILDPFQFISLSYFSSIPLCIACFLHALSFTMTHAILYAQIFAHVVPCYPLFSEQNLALFLKLLLIEFRNLLQQIQEWDLYSLLWLIQIPHLIIKSIIITHSLSVQYVPIVKVSVLQHYFI